MNLTLGVFDPLGELAGDPVIGGPLTLAAARRLAAELNRERARGRDVIADHKKVKVQHKVAAGSTLINSFEFVCRQFVAEHALPKTRRGKDTARLLGLLPDGELVKGGLCSRWSDKPMAEITNADIYGIIDECRRVGVPGLNVIKTDVSDTRGRVIGGSDPCRGCSAGPSSTGRSRRTPAATCGSRPLRPRGIACCQARSYQRFGRPATPGPSARW